MNITITWRNDNPNTIWNVLARKLGRAPTDAEAAAEVQRILDTATIELADQGRLRFQK